MAPKVCRAAVEVQLELDSVLGRLLSEGREGAMRAMEVLQGRCTDTESAYERQSGIAGSLLEAQPPLGQAAVQGRFQQSVDVQDVCQDAGSYHKDSDGSSSGSDNHGMAPEESRHKLASLRQLDVCHPRNRQLLTAEECVAEHVRLAAVESAVANATKSASLSTHLQVKELMSAVSEMKQFAHKTRVFVEEPDPHGPGALVGYAPTHG